VCSRNLGSVPQFFCWTSAGTVYRHRAVDDVVDPATVWHAGLLICLRSPSQSSSVYHLPFYTHMLTHGLEWVSEYAVRT